MEYRKIGDIQEILNDDKTTYKYSLCKEVPEGEEPCKNCQMKGALDISGNKVCKNFACEDVERTDGKFVHFVSGYPVPIGEQININGSEYVCKAYTGAVGEKCTHCNVEGFCRLVECHADKRPDKMEIIYEAL